MKNKNSKAVIYLAIWFMCFCIPGFGQNIKTLSVSDLPWGTIVKGLYQIELDNNSSNYLKEENGKLITAPLNEEDESFYFWITENAWTEKFQIYSAKQQNKLLKINANGTSQMVKGQETTDAENNLLFRMFTEGPTRTKADAEKGIVAIGHVITEELDKNFGNDKCNCNVLSTGSSRYKAHQANNSIPVDYIPIAFEKADNNQQGKIQITGNEVKISQQTSELPKNFVSSNFFVGGFGKNDFKVIIEDGAEGSIGFIEYQYHHLTSNVYANAKPKIGLKVKNGVITLFYLSGKQTLPNSKEKPGGEVVTNFTTGPPITFGFNEQYSFVATQNEKSYELTKISPAELFFNQSITRSARMLTRLKKGTVRLSYTPKNYVINSKNDFGYDDGKNFAATNSFFPYSNSNSLINTFDWQQTQWPVRYYGDNGLVEEKIFSPFYENDMAFSNIAAQYSKSGEYMGAEDFATEEGWELIKANLGYDADGEKKGQAPHHPYVILYNRISSTLRAFVYTNNQGEANQLTVSLGIDRGLPGNNSGDPAYSPKIWGSLQQFKSLDEVISSWYSKAMPFYSTPGRKWYFSDFTMEYDPCIAFFESSIQLKVYKTTEGNLTMVGRLEGGSIPAGTEEYDNWKANRENFLLGVMDNNFGSLENSLGDITFNQYENFDLLKFKDEVKGTLVGKKIADWEKEKARIEWEATKTIGHTEITDGSLQIAEGVAKVVEGMAKGGWVFGKPFEAGAKIAQGVTTMGRGAAKIVKGDARLDLAHAKKLYYNSIKDKVKRSDQEIKMEVPQPRPHAVFGELALKGKLNIETTLVPSEFIATPGGKNSDKAPEWYNNGSWGAAPLYNKPMGNFTLLNQPLFAVGVAKDGDYFNAHLKIKEKPYFAFNRSALGKVDDIVMLAIRVETINNDEHPKAVNSNIGETYTTMYGSPEALPLPGNIDISYLVDWDQIRKNINSLSNKSNANIEAHLKKWIRISYNAWSLTVSNLKSRDLNRVYNNVNQFYTGESLFALENGISGKSIADRRFKNYNFGNNTEYKFGDRYNIYNSDDDFEAIMKTYCDCQNDKAKGRLKTSPKAEIVKMDTPVEERSEARLEVYPNPASSIVNFSVFSNEDGKVNIGLYDIAGKKLISTRDRLNGQDELQGKINIGTLQEGMYFIIVNLPNGKTISQKIIKK